MHAQFDIRATAWIMRQRLPSLFENLGSNEVRIKVALSSGASSSERPGGVNVESTSLCLI